MKTHVALGALLALAIASPALANTSVHVGIGINVPAPVVVYHREPRWVMEPGGSVYVVDDPALGYDYFRYGSWYWIYQNDNWYRARRYNGPFAVVRADYVPAPIWRVDRYRWRHHPAYLPVAIERKYRGRELPPGYQRHEERREEPREDHGHGHDGR